MALWKQDTPEATRNFAEITELSLFLIRAKKFLSEHSDLSCVNPDLNIWILRKIVKIEKKYETDNELLHFRP